MATMSALSAKVAVASVAELKGSRARAAVPARKAVTASAESKEVVSRRAAMGVLAVRRRRLRGLGWGQLLADGRGRRRMFW